MRILIAILLTAATAFAQGQSIPEQGPPPRNLTRLADGSFSANSDPANPENFEIHVVMRGDTLSAIAQQVLDDWRLWPQLWEMNEHIVNPHWIYPNDRILIRPVVLITEAAPPPPPEPAPAPVTPPVVFVPPATEPQREPVEDLFLLTPPPVVSEVKFSDLYCSGFVRTTPASATARVLARYDSDDGVLAAEDAYIYLALGSGDGARPGSVYQVVRPTTSVNSPRLRGAERNLGTHYLDVAQVRVVLAQPEFSLARVVHACEAIEMGDLLLPFQQIDFPTLPRPRSFSPFMAVTGDVQGSVVLSRSALSNFGSTFRGAGITPGARNGTLAGLERGTAFEGSVVYVDVGAQQGVRPGDIFIVYRSIDPGRDGLHELPREASRLQGQRIAVAELVVLKVEERAATALVTYSSVEISQGDSVERR